MHSLFKQRLAWRRKSLLHNAAVITFGTRSVAWPPLFASPPIFPARVTFELPMNNFPSVISFSSTVYIFPYLYYLDWILLEITWQTDLRDVVSQYCVTYKDMHQDYGLSYFEI